MRDGKKKPQYNDRTSEHTISLVLPPPQLDRFNFLDAKLTLYALKQFLAGFSISEDHDKRELKYSVFQKHILGIKTLNINGLKMDFVRTTSSIFLVSETREAQISLKTSVPELDIEKRYVLNNSSDSVNLCRFTVEEFTKILMLANQKTNLAEIKAKLSDCEPTTKSPFFDIKAFAAGISSVSSYKDNSDKTNYVLDHEDGKVYLLYINMALGEHEENKLVYLGKSQDDLYYLHHIEVV